ncbi:MAG TPA: XdhC family protein, partial [Thermoanaerobaculia bacterium]|nr:XdhC family protein [Thermoanaerobaculia bacterium]
MASAVEILAIVRLARQCASDGVPAVLARLVSVEGSHYRKPGARMLLARDGRSAGAISAGCLEADLRERLPGVLSSGRAEIVEYDSRTFEDLVWGLGSGCNGRVRILLSPLTASLREALERAGATLSGGAAVRLSTVVLAPAGSDRPAGEVRLLAAGESIPEEDGAEVIVEEIPPPISLLIAGCGSDAVPVARMAAELGWTVSVLADHDLSFVLERFAGLPVAHAGGNASASAVPVHPRSAAVVMSHSFADDAAALAALLPRGFPYLGVLGPRERTRRLLASCGGSEAAEIHSPAGLNLGAETAEEIALSIVAEIQATL